MGILPLHTIKKKLSRFFASKLFNDSLWSLIGNVLGRGLSLVAGILVARFLGKDIYGEYGIIKTTLIYLEIFSTFGLGYTATKYLADYKNNHKESVRAISKIAKRITLFTSGIMGVLLLIFADKIAVLIEAPQVVTALRISSVGVILNAYNAAQIGILSGFSTFKIIAINTTLAGILNFIFTVILTYLYGLDGAVAALTLSYGFQCLFNSVSISKLIRDYPPYTSIQKGLQKELFFFSLPIALQESLFSVTNWFVSFMLIRLVGYGELGLYSAAGQWGAIIAFIPGILRNVTLAHLSGSRDANIHSRTIDVMIAVNACCTTIMSAVIIIAAGFICSFYGSTFTGLKSVLIVTVLIPIVSSISNVYVQEFMSVGKNWLVFLCKLLRDLLILVITTIFIIKYDLRGALTLTSVTLVVTTIYTLVLFCFYKRGKQNYATKQMGI